MLVKVKDLAAKLADNGSDVVGLLSKLFHSHVSDFKVPNLKSFVVATPFLQNQRLGRVLKNGTHF